MTKINQFHLERAAYIYIRQSKPEQVRNNVESRRRQYSLADRARQLGFRDVQRIDEDLARSASGHVDRHGFEALLAAVCRGEVGAVFVVDASRLARNGHEWHRLLEFCGIVDTLIVDHDGVYDPKHPNDRLLLGLKGMMSEMETATFRQRSQEAIRQMARRGEYYTRIPEGYVLRDAKRLEKDPDEQVRRASELVFSKFRELGSARQVSLWLRQEQILVPRRRSPLADPVDFVPATTWRIHRAAQEPSLRRCLCVRPDASPHRPDRRTETTGEATGAAAGSVAGAPPGPPRGLHHVAGVPDESGTARAEPECAGRGRIGCGSSGQRSAGRTGALRPMWTKDARPVQRPP
jgi:DNA invertase Pin-like site-specific DNA recombinase